LVRRCAAADDLDFGYRAEQCDQRRAYPVVVVDQEQATTRAGRIQRDLQVIGYTSRKDKCRRSRDWRNAAEDYVVPESLRRSASAQ
jgi:hypothetical protein